MVALELFAVLAATGDAFDGNATTSTVLPLGTWTDITGVSVTIAANKTVLLADVEGQQNQTGWLRVLIDSTVVMYRRMAQANYPFIWHPRVPLKIASSGSSRTLKLQLYADNNGEGTGRIAGITF